MSEIILRADCWVRIKFLLEILLELNPLGFGPEEMGLGFQLANTEFFYWVWCVKRGGGT